MGRTAVALRHDEAQLGRQPGEQLSSQGGPQAGSFGTPPPSQGNVQTSGGYHYTVPGYTPAGGQPTYKPPTQPSQPGYAGGGAQNQQGPWTWPQNQQPSQPPQGQPPQAQPQVQPGYSQGPPQQTSWPPRTGPQWLYNPQTGQWIQVGGYGGGGYPNYPSRRSRASSPPARRLPRPRRRRPAAATCRRPASTPMATRRRASRRCPRRTRCPAGQREVARPEPPDPEVRGGPAAPGHPAAHEQHGDGGRAHRVGVSWRGPGRPWRRE